MISAARTLMPQIASTLCPEDFVKYITDPGHPIFVPKLCMVELQLEGLGGVAARVRGSSGTQGA